MELINKWNFKEQMKLYLFYKAENLLEATVKLSKLSYEIQQLLRNHYSEEHRYPMGSIFRCFGVHSYMYTLFIHYSTVVLEKPIYCFDFEEWGISDYSCSKKNTFFKCFGNRSCLQQLRYLEVIYHQKVPKNLTNFKLMCMMPAIKLYIFIMDAIITRKNFSVKMHTTPWAMVFGIFCNIISVLLQ